MVTTTATPAAGWYTDPADSTSERWWGGLEWTDHVRPIVAPTIAPSVPLAAAAPAPQLAAPSSHAAHAALPQHAAPSPLATQPSMATAAPAMAAAPAPAPAPSFDAPYSAPSFSVTTPEPPAPPAPVAQAPVAPAPAPAPLAPPAAQLPPAAAAPPTLPPPSANTLVLTPAAEAAIPQYASQLVPSADAALGVKVTAWDAIPATSGPSSFFTEPPAANPYPFRTAPPPTPGTAIAPAAPAAAPTWVSGGYAKPVDPPSNSPAVAGFVLSMLGFNIVGLFVSLAGLRKARELEASGQRPVGRTLARWGVGISTVTLVLGVIIASLFFTVGSAFFSAAGGYNKELYQATLSAEYAKQTGETPLSVECPPTGSFDRGNIIDCTVKLVDGTTFLLRTTTMTDGTRSIEQIV